MDQKDHLTEILTLRERADEDRYFAERDRELIARLKHTQESELDATIHASQSRPRLDVGNPVERQLGLLRAAFEQE